MYKGLVFLLFITLLSCSKEEPKFGRKEMHDKLKSVYPKVEFIIPSDISKGIQCSDYGPGCLGGLTIKLKHMEVIVVEFQSLSHARAEAKRIGQWYARNFLIDDIMGEPILEKFFAKHFEAKPGVIFKD